jgi:phosphatidylethanolamine/phosphatidyl-N-methylethanolamine N-methyltransferase
MSPHPHRPDRDTLDQDKLNNAYALWAPVYDLVFGAVFNAGRKASIEAAEKIGGRILDVGIGTGLALLDFSRANKIVGVDISEPMLRKAQRRVDEANLTNVECLAVMDAASLGFPDNSFDVTVAQFVITAVPDPDATLDEFLRVTKPGGEIILVNHIGAESGPRYVFEQCFAPVARYLGWRPEFQFARIENWVARAKGVRLVERRPIQPFGHFSVIRFHKEIAVAAA